MLGRLPVLVALSLLALPIAGCLDLSGGATLDGAALAGAPLRVVDAGGEPVADAAVTLLAGEEVVARASTALDGSLLLPAVAFDRAVVAASGYAPRVLDVGALDGPVVPDASADALASDATPGLRMLPPHDFGSIALGPPELCGARNTCGLSEPVTEVAGDGSIYVSSTCCIGAAPPVWVSRDGGATWTTLDTPGVREATGIEGDFAIDDAGNVYFTDILVGAMWITAWDAQGAWLHTTAVPFEPLVDRPWVRAGADGVVYFLYNTGFATNFHVSTDHGRTFSPVPLKQFPVGLGTIAQGPEREHLWVVAGMRLYESTDGGATWSAGEDVPTPDAEGGRAGFAVPAVDEAGRVLVAFDHGTAESGYAIHAAVRDPAGEWRVEQVSRANGTHVMPWPAGGPDGGFVIAWYGTDDDAASPNTVAPDAAWHVLLAATHDAGASWQTVKADPEPLMSGPMNRRLLDFLQVRIAPDGAAHLVYAENRDGSNEEHTWYARTTLGLGLAPRAYLNGPHAAGTQAERVDGQAAVSRLL